MKRQEIIFIQFSLKRMISIMILLSCMLFQPSYAQKDTDNHPFNFSKLNDSHDIQLSPWGPYSKKYAGISHIPDIKKGFRFDFSVMPGYYRNSILIPNVLFQSGYFPWESNNEMTRFTYRYELEWKDKVYADVTYHIIDSGTVIAEIKCVNNAAVPQNLVLNLMSFMDYPDDYPDKQVQASKEVVWHNATDYQSLTYAKKGPQDNLVYDGYKRGEVRGSGYINGTAIAKRFGKNKGDKVIYKINLQNKETGRLNLVYRLKENGQSLFKLSGIANQDIVLKGTGRFEQVEIPYTIAKTGDQTLTLESMGGDEAEFNGFFVIPGGVTETPGIIPLNKSFEPIRTKGLAAGNIILKYKDIPEYYGVAWDSKSFELREVKNDELDIFFRKLVHNHVSKTFEGNNKGHYTNIFIRPVELAPESEKTLYAILCNGGLETVKARLKDFNSLRNTVSTQKNSDGAEDVLPEGKKYQFARQMLKATLLSNIVYPVYTQGGYIRHFTPGKWWNSLYTWDSGFIGIGLNEINPSLAIDCINAYTTEPGSQSAFIHHGSPVPVQMYAFFDLWNKTQSKDLLAYFYPRLKQYYEFLAGRSGNSATRTPSGMIKTWDYFYNSAGWDDYPAQAAVHDQKAEQWIAPVSNTAHCIRVAKILSMAAEALGKNNDLKSYRADISQFTEVLQKYSWNPESGYFSYVLLDEKGMASGKYKNESGKDYNMGLDGAYPLFSGICTPEQEEILLEKMFSEKHMWTPSGMGVVDQSAAYYKTDGYWNGSVWMPHQWFMWKAMLDIGRTDLAFKIAQKAMDIYSKEVNESYYTFEHFFAKTGRGAGWHQFSGLSAPILSWYAAYFKPGTITTGFEIWIKNQTFIKDNSHYQADLVFDKSTRTHKRSLLVCLNPKNKYRVTFNKKEIIPQIPYDGLLQITLPDTNDSGRLIISSIATTGN